MKVYAVPEFEFDSLAVRNTQGTTYYSIASFLLSAALSVWVNAAFYTEVPAAASVMKTYAAPLVLVVSVLFFFLGWMSGRSRQSTWARIKAESVSLPRPENSGAA
jgi:hypothetical protein